MIWIGVETDFNKAARVCDAALGFQIVDNLFCAFFFLEFLLLLPPQSLLPFPRLLVAFSLEVVGPFRLFPRLGLGQLPPRIFCLSAPRFPSPRFLGLF